LPNASSSCGWWGISAQIYYWRCKACRRKGFGMGMRSKKLELVGRFIVVLPFFAKEGFHLGELFVSD